MRRSNASYFSSKIKKAQREDNKIWAINRWNNCWIFYRKCIRNVTNRVLVLQMFPDRWRKAIVILIQKPGKDSLTEETETKKLIPDFQFGFKVEHFCEQQALRLTLNHTNSVLFLEMEKASFSENLWHPLESRIHIFTFANSIVILLASWNLVNIVEYGQ